MLLPGTHHFKEQEGKGHYNKFHKDILSRKDFPKETFTSLSSACVLWTEPQLDNHFFAANFCCENFFNSILCQTMFHAHSHFFLVIKEKKSCLKSYSESWVTPEDY